MSLWYDIKKKSYAYDAKESWLRSYADKIVSALKTELLEKLGEHYAGKLGPHNASDVNCDSGESVQTALDLEAAERTSGDDLVTSLVATEKEARVVGDNSVRSLVAQEEIARKGADNEVKGLVTQEEKSRIAGDNEIKELLAEEEEARLSALDLKVDKVSGKDLSTNDYSNTDKLKLAGIESGAQVNTVTSVAGKTGAVTLAKSDVGLSNVNNTSDLNKPISNATATALEAKANTSDVLTKNNASAFTPSGSYNPATKKYVDDQVATMASGGSVDLSSYLAKDNAEAFTPTGDYNPATKKYVDDNSIAKLITSDGGVHIAESSNASYGIAIGSYSNSSSFGIAVGTATYTTGEGSAVGFSSKASNGGAIGAHSATGDGFAGGYCAQTMDNNGNYIDAIQLGNGTNPTAKTLQVYDFQLLDADGNIPNDRLKNALILTSSTEGSTKQFKLTVDDNGTISAVEV